ncbi:hypothetical protein MA9V1_155 [Chryseobacterium phage MA9V-1]|nr:hypothetical protein MA9V1_155 [Chryseobacterium phage MA9V-1]
MNIANIQRAIDHLKTIQPEHFDMTAYRDVRDQYEPQCNSVGCIVGHCTILDNDNIYANFIERNDTIMFTEWSCNFFGIGLLSKTWDYMFSCTWADAPKTNTIEHAIYRMERIIAGYKPGQIDEEFAYETGYTELEPGYTDND